MLKPSQLLKNTLGLLNTPGNIITAVILFCGAVATVMRFGWGIGAVMGSKMLKAIALQGSQPVHIAGDKADWEKLINYHRTIIGANNQHVVPNFPSPLFEYWDAGSRWVGAPGKRWGASEASVTLTGDVRSLNRISYRTNNAAYFLGDNVWQYTVRNNGCFS